ncbi:UNVERIFIED_CONTAM: hypothetical protein FKN15_028580 [Acipenser sinensis]
MLWVGAFVLLRCPVRAFVLRRYPVRAMLWEPSFYCAALALLHHLLIEVAASSPHDSVPRESHAPGNREALGSSFPQARLPDGDNVLFGSGPQPTGVPIPVWRIPRDSRPPPAGSCMRLIASTGLSYDNLSCTAYAVAAEEHHHHILVLPRVVEVGAVGSLPLAVEKGAAGVHQDQLLFHLSC